MKKSSIRLKHTFLIIICISMGNTIQGQNKIKLRQSQNIESNQKSQQTLNKKKAKVAASSIGKKDLWLAVGMSLSVPGGGHFYIGNYSSGLIIFIGAYGLIGAGIGSMLSAHATKDVIINGKNIREEDDTNKSLFMVGSIFLASGILFYIGSVIDVFIDVNDHNRRIDRLRRYNRNRVSKKTTIFLAQTYKTYYIGKSYHF